MSSPISKPSPATNEGYIVTDKMELVYFNKYTLRVTYITGNYKYPLKRGVHECGEYMICADGVVLCEKCNEVVTF